MDVENKKSKKYKPLERVTIEDDLKDKLSSLTAMANESLQGITEVSKSDLINLILRLHAGSLSKLETDELRKIHFDVFKCLSWLQTKAKDAKEKGAEVSLKELFEKSSEFMTDASSDSSVKKVRAPRKNKTIKTENSEELNQAAMKTNATATE